MREKTREINLQGRVVTENSIQRFQPNVTLHSHYEVSTTRLRIAEPGRKREESWAK